MMKDDVLLIELALKAFADIANILTPPLQTHAMGVATSIPIIHSLCIMDWPCG
jgi:hypothetical protein